MVESTDRAEAIEHGDPEARQEVGVGNTTGGGILNGKAQLLGTLFGERDKAGDWRCARHRRVAPATLKLGCRAGDVGSMRDLLDRRAGRLDILGLNDSGLEL